MKELSLLSSLCVQTLAFGILVFGGFLFYFFLQYVVMSLHKDISSQFLLRLETAVSGQVVSFIYNTLIYVNIYIIQ